MSIFRLKVQHLEQICWFELSWGQGQQLSATLKYPTLVAECYQDWRRIYLSFYKTAELPLLPADSPQSEPLRGWTIAGGQLAPSAVDWHSQLVEAEILLLKEFHRWLRSAELFEIRATIARASREVAVSDCPALHSIDVFLTCIPMDLARFPWEVWEIGADVTATGTIRIIRAPAVIRSSAMPPMKSVSLRQRRGRARILAILGDDTGLDFQTDRAAVRSLARIAEVTFVGWQPGQTATEVKEKIQQAISHEQGWDVLFFAGHSNETEITGGELVIAPGVSISIHDIEAQLMAAKARGLQVAIFNSCSGLNIAESLIDLGFSQVAVMREPIHNQVAQEFLVQFLRGLADSKDVHESLVAACEFLRLKKNLTYPSACLVPSLFCHPGAALYRIPPWRWQRYLQPFLPTRREAIVLTAGIALSLIAPVQAALLDVRVGVQALYRDYTGQVPAIAVPPPVALVQIDTASISRSGISQTNPIDRSYLAQIIDRLTALDAPLIGLDFLLDTTQQSGDQALGKAVQTAVAQNGTWFVFAAGLDLNSQAVKDEDANAEENSGKESISENGINPATQIASLNWSLQGYTDAEPHHVMLPYPNEDCRQTCPFAYLLSLVHTAERYPPDSPVPQPQLNHTLNLRQHFLDTIDSNRSPSPPLTLLRQLHLSSISVWAYDQWGQHWLEPVIDFSIPADRVYDRIPAWQLLDTDQADAARLSQQIVMIAPGDDERLGTVAGQPDRFPAPAALRYWNSQYWLTGGESLAYMMHHQITQRLVIPVPNLWMVAGAALLGKSAVLWFNHQQKQRQWTRQQRQRYIAGLIGLTALYGLVGLQLYISSALLWPWLLPTVVLWTYILPAFRSSTDA